MDSVGESETLARFLTRSKHFNASGVTRHAFMPDPHRDLSVSRIDGLNETEIIARGVAVVEETEASLYGWGRLDVATVLKQGLEVHPAVPPPGHAIIVGWPEEKEGRISIAQQLAKVAQLHGIP